MIFFQAEDGIRDPEMSRGLGDVYKRQVLLKFSFESKENRLTFQNTFSPRQQKV